MKSILLGALALVTTAAAGLAFAADLPLKSPAPPAPMYNWTGWYIGGNADIAWASDTLTGYSGSARTAPFFATGGLPTTLAPGVNGYSGGAQFGYNWQVSHSWLVGFETDIQGGGYKGNSSIPSNLAPLTTSVEQHSDWYGTVRGRVGVVFAPNMLWYTTAGLAYGQAESSQSTVGNGLTVAQCPATLPCAANSVNATRYGWAAGTGYEIMFAPNWTVKTEYLYVDLGTQSLAATTPAFTPPVTFTSSNKFRENIIRIGFNYIFGGPVVAKY